MFAAITVLIQAIYAVILTPLLSPRQSV